MPGQTASGFPYILATDPVINAPDTWEALALRLEQEDDNVDTALGNLKPKEHTHPDPVLGIRQQYVALTATKGDADYPGQISVGSGDGYVRLVPAGDGYITVEEDGVGLFSVYANAEGSAGLPSGTYLRFRFTREEFNGKPQDHTGYLDVEIKAGHNVITAHNWQITTEAGRKYSVWVDVRREGGAASGSVKIDSRQFKMHNIIVGAATEVPGTGGGGGGGNGVAPTGMVTHIKRSNSGDGVVVLPAFPADMTSAVALVGYRGRKDMVVPDGWRLVATGAHGENNSWGGRISQWAMLAIDNATGAEELVCSFPTVVGGEESTYGSGTFAVAYFTGGSGGKWSCVEGTHSVGVSSATMANVPSGAAAWFQCGLTSAGYAGVSFPPGTSEYTGFLGNYCFPGEGTWAVMPADPIVDGLVDWDNVGAYGSPCSVNIAAVWSP